MLVLICETLKCRLPGLCYDYMMMMMMIMMMMKIMKMSVIVDIFGLYTFYNTG